jgi:hypothetical protein
MSDTKELSKIAAKFRKAGDDEIFRMFYDALPVTSPAFQTLANDIRSMADFCPKPLAKDLPPHKEYEGTSRD